MNNIYNFSAGPAMLPKDVLLQMKEELLDWHDTGISLLELGHRTSEFCELAARLEENTRKLLKVPDDFHVLFLTGGARGQFAFLVMNLLRSKRMANYVETGYWSAMAAEEARKYCNVHVAASSKADKFLTIPPLADWKIDYDAAFLHYTDNETISGVEFQAIPDVDDLPLVSDMTSNLFSRPVNFNKLGMVYASAQKNVGIAGMCLVIVRKDLCGEALPQTPAVFDYALQAKNESMLSTPTTFAWYAANLVLEWLQKQGGVEQIVKINQQKANKLYQYLDSSNFYHNQIDPAYRSRMNVTFELPSAELEKQFLAEAEKEGFKYLQGHRSLGGLRASIYNAFSETGVDEFIQFLTHFAKKS